jgi:hypothetical protein
VPFIPFQVKDHRPIDPLERLISLASDKDPEIRKETMIDFSLAVVKGAPLDLAEGSRKQNEARSRSFRSASRGRLSGAVEHKVTECERMTVSANLRRLALLVMLCASCGLAKSASLDDPPANPIVFLSVSAPQTQMLTGGSNPVPSPECCFVDGFGVFRNNLFCQLAHVRC